LVTQVVAALDASVPLVNESNTPIWTACPAKRVPLGAVTETTKLLAAAAVVVVTAAEAVYVNVAVAVTAVVPWEAYEAVTV